MNASLERHFWRWASLFVLLYLACSIAKDIRRSMWLDELYTYQMATQANPKEIVNAILQGCDGAPPLYDIIVQAILPIVKPAELAVRLPSTLGFCVMLLCLCAFCRRRMPALYAFITALIACYICQYYATEGRGYGIVLGCAAGALLCWQYAAQGQRRSLTVPLFALCLALMIPMHYYSVFFLIPLFLAEMYRAWTSRKLDFPILAAMVPAVLILALHYPLFVAAKPSQAHYWAPANISSIWGFYNTELFIPLRFFIAPILIAIAFAPKSPEAQSQPPSSMLPHEWVVICGIALMPVVAVTVSVFFTHAFVERYIIWVVTGFALLMGATLSTALHRRPAVGMILLLMLAGMLPWQAYSAYQANGDLREGEAVLRQLRTLPDGPEPILIADHHIFVELIHYAEPRLTKRLIYPVSRDLDLKFLNTDTHSLLMAALGRRGMLRVEELRSVLAQYPSFLLFAGSPDYMPMQLRNEGYSVTQYRHEDLRPILYSVKAPDHVHPN